MTPADYVQGAISELRLVFEDRHVLDWKPSTVHAEDFVHHVELSLEQHQAAGQVEQPAQPADADADAAAAAAAPAPETPRAAVQGEVSLSPESSPMPTPQPKEEQVQAPGAASASNPPKRPRIADALGDAAGLAAAVAAVLRHAAAEDDDASTFDMVLDPAVRASALQARVFDAERQLKLAGEEKAKLIQKLEATKASEERAGEKLKQQETNISVLHQKQEKWLKRCEELRDPLTLN